MNSDNGKDGEDKNKVVESGKNLAKDAIKDKAVDSASKAIASKGAGAAAGGTNPASSIVGGVSDAAEAIKNKDGMGVVDAGVKTGAVAAATAFGSPVAGAATEMILNTKIGKKATRITSRLVVIAVIAPLMAMFLFLIAIIGAIGSVTQGLNPAQAQMSAFASGCLTGNDVIIDDPVILETLKLIVSQAPTQDYANIGVMDYLARNDSAEIDPIIAAKDARLLYAKIKYLGFDEGLKFDSKLYRSNKINSVFDIVRLSSTTLPWDILAYVNEDNKDFQLGDYVMAYPLAYWTVNNMFIQDSKLAQKVVNSDYPVTDYTKQVAIYFNNGKVPDSCNGVSDQPLDPGKQVKAFGDGTTQTLQLDVTGAEYSAKNNSITYFAINNLPVGQEITVAGLSNNALNVELQPIVSRNDFSFTVANPNSKLDTSIKLTSKTAILSTLIEATGKLPDKYDVEGAIRKAISYNHNPPPVSPVLSSGNCLSPGCDGDCDHLAGIIWGYRNSGYETALTHWNTLVRDGQAHVNDNNPPRGALIFWGDDGSGRHRRGHVSVYIGKEPDARGNMTDYVITNWGNPSSVSKQSISTVASDNFNYLGWAEPIFIGPKL